MIKLEQTCGACPEQYDAWDGQERVGYLRLRHGYFRVDYPDCGGEIVYEASPEGDGCFTTEERHRYLSEAVAAIQEYRRKQNPLKILVGNDYEIGVYRWQKIDPDTWGMD